MVTKADLRRSILSVVPHEGSASVHTMVKAVTCAASSSRLKLLRFLEVGEVDLKWLFDHFRNYGIAGALMFASNHVAGKPSGSLIPHFNEFAAVAFAVMSAMLFILNFIHGGLAYKKQFGRQSMWTYAVLAIVWFMLMEALMETRVAVISFPVAASPSSSEATFLHASTATFGKGGAIR